MQTKRACAKPRRLTLPHLGTVEIDYHQASPWFEDASHFSESQTFEIIRQMVHHQGREHHIKRVVGEGEVLDDPDLEVDGQADSLGFGTGTDDLLGTGVNAAHAACYANTLARFQSPRAGAAPHIEHRLSSLKLSQVGDPLRKLPQLAT